MERTADILAFVPSAPDWQIPWEKIEEAAALQGWIERLTNTMQNPRWHGEGDVWTHTRMVCGELAGMEDFRNLEERKRQEVFLAALLHDFGKAVCTRRDREVGKTPHAGKENSRRDSDTRPEDRDGEKGSGIGPEDGDGEKDSDTGPKDRDGEKGSGTGPEDGDGEKGSGIGPEDGDGEKDSGTGPEDGDGEKGSGTGPEDGNWISPNHGAIGARIAREILWSEYGFAGTADLLQFRETVCSLVRYHPVPPHILKREHPEHQLIRIAAGARLTPDFSLELLLLLEKADMRGRIAEDAQDAIEQIELCGLSAKECGCLRKPVPFPDDFSEYIYLSKGHTLPGQQMYDDTWGEVILLCGLPGTGKDTWIRENCPKLPMVSLDEIRKEMKPHEAKDGARVAAAGRERAREYLRKKTTFVWNATCLTPDIRSRQIRLFEKYGARVRIIYLETDPETRIQRNLSRSETQAVPEAVVRSMLRKLVLPERFEAHRVIWECV